MNINIKSANISQTDYLASACCSNYDHCNDGIKEECKYCYLYHFNKDNN